MKIKGSLIQNKKASHKKLELLRQISEDAVREGVATINDVQTTLDQREDYKPEIFWPMNSLTSVYEFDQGLRETLVECKSIVGLSKQYIDVLVGLQEELYSKMQGNINDWHSLYSKVSSLGSYDRYLQRSVGATMSVLPITFWSAPEQPLDSSLPNCHLTLNNQLALPIKKRTLHPIRNISFESFVDDTDGNIFTQMQVGPILFKLAEKTSLENLRYSIELEQEEMLNHIRIPLALPLPVHIKNIILFDSAMRQTYCFDKSAIAKLSISNPTALELIFPPVPCKNICIEYDADLDLQKIGLTKKVTTDHIETEVVADISYNIELSSARGQVDKNLLTESVNSLISLIARDGSKEGLENLSMYYSVLGVVVECSLIEFKRSGSTNVLAYYGNDVHFSIVRADGEVNKFDKTLVNLTSATERTTFVNVRVQKSCRDRNNKLLSRIEIPHPISRPFSSAVYELATASDRRDRSTEVPFTQKNYRLNYFTSTPSSVNLFVPTNNEKNAVIANVESDDDNRITQIIANNVLNQDIIAEYTLDFLSSPSDAKFSDEQPFYISSLGSIVYRPSIQAVDKCDIYLIVELHRVSHEPYLSPLLNKASIVLGHKANERRTI